MQFAKYTLSSICLTVIMICLNLPVHGNGSFIDKEQKCVQILNKLKQAKGLIPDSSPRFSLVPHLPDNRFVIAMIHNKEETIYLQEKTYDLCMQLMEKDSTNGLAFVLAHELAHFIKKHNVRQQFISKYDGDVTQSQSFRTIMAEAQPEMESMEIEAMNDKYSGIVEAYNIRKNEAEADLEAGFLCYKAGYPALEAGPLFLDLAYQVFDISDNGQKYASLAERKQIVQQTGLKLDSLIQVFETGNYLAAAGEYFYAAKCYEHISSSFESKEILNNIALLYMLDVTQDIFVDHLPYALPATLATSLFETSKPIITPNPNQEEDVSSTITISNYEDFSKLSRLETAIKYLNKSISINEGFTEAYLNMSICYFLKFIVGEHSQFGVKFHNHNLDYAHTSLLKAFEKVGSDEKAKQTHSDLLCQSAIINHASKNYNSANQDIMSSLEMNPNNIFSKTNLKYFNGDLEAHRFAINDENQTPVSCTKKEEIGEKTLSEIMDSNDSQWTTVYNINLSHKEKQDSLFVKYNGIKIEGENYLLCSVSYNQYAHPKERIDFLIAQNKPTTESACGLKVNDIYETLLHTYGSVSNKLNKDEGRYETYENIVQINASQKNYSGIIFDLNHMDIISNWIIYNKLKEDYFDPQFSGH